MKLLLALSALFIAAASRIVRKPEPRRPALNYDGTPSDDDYMNHPSLIKRTNGLPTI